MRAPVLLIGCTAILLSSGCFTSTQPLYTPETLKKDADLAGTWASYDAGIHAVRHLTVVTDSGEGVLHARDEGTREEIELRAVELDGSLYLDVRPPNNDGHLIFAARLERDRLLVALVDQDKIRAHATRANIPFWTGWKLTALGAPTPELQRFVAEHRADIFDFQGPIEFKRIKRAESAE